MFEKILKKIKSIMIIAIFLTVSLNCVVVKAYEPYDKTTNAGIVTSKTYPSVTYENQISYLSNGTVDAYFTVNYRAPIVYTYVGSTPAGIWLYSRTGMASTMPYAGTNVYPYVISFIDSLGITNDMNDIEKLRRIQAKLKTCVYDQSASLVKGHSIFIDKRGVCQDGNYALVQIAEMLGIGNTFNVIEDKLGKNHITSWYYDIQDNTVYDFDSTPGNYSANDYNALVYSDWNTVKVLNSYPELYKGYYYSLYGYKRNDIGIRAWMGQ